MAARKFKVRLDQNWRERIKVTVLLNLLEKHALGEKELAPTQLKAIEILLRKVAPDLQAIEHTGEVQHSYVARTPQVEVSTDSWALRYQPLQ